MRSQQSMNEKAEPQPDRELVQGVRSGDLEAFAALVKRYRDAYTRFAVRMTGSLLDADDVMQSVWMRAFRNIGACKNPDRFGAWLYQDRRKQMPPLHDPSRGAGHPIRRRSRRDVSRAD